MQLSGMEREYIRDRTLEGHESARARGKPIGGAAVTDEAMLAVALHLRGQERSLRGQERSLRDIAGGAGNNGPVNTVTASSFLNAAGTMGG